MTQPDWNKNYKESNHITSPYKLLTVGSADFAANRLGNMNTEILQHGDILEHTNGSWMILVERLGIDGWIAQELAIKPAHIEA